MAGDLKITGARELNAALLELSTEVSGRLGENSVRAGARVIAAEARRRAPRDRPLYFKTIRIFRDPAGRRSGERTAYAGTRSPLGHLLEFGTVHMSARPHFRPAIDESGQAAVDKMTDNLRAGINRVAVKRGGKADGPTSAGSDLDLFFLGFELGAGE